MSKLLRVTKTVDFMVRLPSPCFGGEPSHDEILEEIDEFLMNSASDLGLHLSEELLLDSEAEIEVEDVHAGGGHVRVEET